MYVRLGRCIVLAHEIETMFYNREVPWHGLGVKVEKTLNSPAALKMAGLDWEVLQRPVQVDGVVLNEYQANVRSSDKSVLGIVGRDYKVVQNQDAFAFTDKLLGAGTRYETAGSLQKGKRVWLLARMEQNEILGDPVVPYLLFSNGHDGRNAVRVAITPVRVVCQNTLNLALKNAERSWSATHIGRLEDKIPAAATALSLANKDLEDEALRTLALTDLYLNELSKSAQSLVKKKVNDKEIARLVEQVLPLTPDRSRHNRIYELRSELLLRYHEAPDLRDFRGTGWGFINAVSDLVSHTAPKRYTTTFQENRFAKVTSGAVELDRAVRLLLAM